MPPEEKPERGVIAFARQVAGMSQPAQRLDSADPAPISERFQESPPRDRKNDLPGEGPGPINEPENAIADGLEGMNPATVAARAAHGERKQRKTSDEIAKIILDALRTIDGCAKRGFIVTVYGSNPWSAMLMIKPEAGPVIDGPLWYSRVRELGVQLRRHFDVIEDAPSLTGSAGD